MENFKSDKEKIPVLKQFPLGESLQNEVSGTTTTKRESIFGIEEIFIIILNRGHWLHFTIGNSPQFIK